MSAATLLEERFVDVLTVDGAMNSFVVRPAGSGRWPVAVVYMDAWGLREELCAMARRIAGWGYFVLLPNLYYRQTHHYERVAGDAGMAEMLRLMETLSNATAVADTRAIFDYLDGDPCAQSHRVGAIGYCMSGPFVIAAAATFPERVKCIAVVHGARLVTEEADSAHVLAQRVRCSTYVACAENDRWASPEEIDQLERQLAASGSPYEVDWFAGAKHGFVFPAREGAYDEAGAERHWNKVQQLLARTLND
jgi:carboxymethylenebutenolidase